MPYPVPYILLVLFFAAVGYLRYREADEQHRLYCDVAAVAAFVFFFGLRGFLLTDFELYYPYYHSVEWGDVFNYFIPNKYGLEPGFALLCLVCKTVSGANYHFLEFTITCIFLGCVCHFLRRYTSNIALGLMLLVAFDGVGILCNLLRNQIAIGIFLVAIPYIEQRRLVPYLLMCLLALTFHVSALVYVPLYFFFHRFFSRWVYLAVFVVGNVAFVTHFSLVERILDLMTFTGDAAMKASAYTGRMTKAVPVFTIGFLERLLTGTLVILYHDKLKALHQGSGVIVNGVFLYLIMFFFFSQFDILSRRFSILFCFGYWLLWLDLLRCFYFENNRRLMAAFIGAYALLHTYSLTNNPGSMYENLLFGAQSFNERMYYNSRIFHHE